MGMERDEGQFAVCRLVMVVGTLMTKFLVGVVGLRGWSHGVPCSHLLLMGWKVLGQCPGQCALWLGIDRGQGQLFYVALSNDAVHYPTGHSRKRGSVIGR